MPGELDEIIKMYKIATAKYFLFLTECTNSGCTNNLQCIIARNHGVSEEEVLCRYCKNPNRKKSFPIHKFYS